ncbi:putative cyclase/dehydrase protein [Cinnamomum micranthum f. kanehirae]|uniref:Putative cyclase/dehydrase protein n=1 Tax=Cinnamomum micranthum f. kanehirae TaxID=337451 RepID=A0A3S3NW61_9MAGN|nr:putative cyclase/dehydrase protein [Cinnamomum micranthum f. kanehirae]
MFSVTTFLPISSIPASLQAHTIITPPRHEAFSNAIFMSSKSPLITHLFLRRRISSGVLKRISISKAIRPTMQWQHCRVKVEVDVPCSVAYSFYSDREATPRWLPLISSVKVLDDKPDLSRWLLEHEVLGQKFEFSWLARNLQPIPNHKIHWQSLDGVHNKGAVRFYPKGPSSCLIELNVSFEVPPILIPVSSTLRPFLEGLLLHGLERFGKVAKYRHRNNHKV